MSKAPALALALMLLASAASAEDGPRLYYSFLKSFHPNPGDYATWHPSAGLDGPLDGEWLRWRVGVSYNSQSRWGPFAGLVVTTEVAENWRAGVAGGTVGGFERGEWFGFGALPIVQWRPDSGRLIWELGAMWHPDTTFVGLGLHILY